MLSLLFIPSQVAHADDDDFNLRAHVHIRPEVRTNPAFESGLDDSLLAVQQSARLGLSTRRGPLRADIDLQAVQAWGTRSGSTGAEATAHAYQAFIQVGGGDSWLRLGRQEIHLLNGLRMSKAPWNPIGRTFDGARGHLKAGDWTLDAFTVMLSEPQPAGDVQTTSSLGETHTGFYATLGASENFKPTAFVMGRFAGPTDSAPDREKWWAAPGLRLLATPGRSSIDLNLAGQIGDDSGTPIRAYSGMLRARQGLGGSWKTGVGVILEQNSGHACENDPGTGDCVTDTIRDFEGGFGRNHFLRGFADQVQGSNVRDLGLQLDTTPWKKDGPDKPTHRLTTTLQAHLFQLVDTEGAWHRNGGNLQGMGWELGNTDPNIGWEIDALFGMVLGPAARIDGGVCIFQPIGVGARLTGDAPMTYAFVRNRFSF
jgi:hypothetical protein